jgi:type II secretory pathway component PulF
MKLSPRQLALLLDEVAAMSRSERSIALGLADLSHPSLGLIGKAAATLGQKIDSGQPLEMAVAEIGGRYGNQASAALRALQATGSNLPLARLAEALRRQSELHVHLMVAMIYPLITALIAYLLVSLGVTTLVIENWPTELIGRGDSQVFIQFCVHLRTYFWVPPLVVGLLLMGFWVRYRFGSRNPIWSRLGDHFRWSVFCDMLSVQVMAEVPLPAAIKLAADAAGLDQACSVSEEKVVDQSPPMIRWLISYAGKAAVTETARELSVLADWYRYKAMMRWRYWGQWFPIFVTAFAGGGACLIYCWLILVPLFDGMLRVVQ